MRSYEIMFILHPSSSDEQISQLVGQMEELVKNFKGEIDSIDQMGKKRLAYQIENVPEGYYILFNLKGTGECIKEFERRLKVTERVIRYLTVRVDEELKRANKIKEARLKKTKKRNSSPETDVNDSAL
tara:strand:+ start:97 stop:480 length:384 start_codon:yes stop_codon:yes gene_type:complete